MMTRMIKTTLAGIGILIFLSGVLAGLQRSLIGATIWQLRIWDITNEIPEFFVGLQCPKSMQLEEKQSVTASIERGPIGRNPVKVSLYGSGFDIDPSETYQVRLADDEAVELSWILTARGWGIQEVGIPVNMWDRSECFIFVHNSPWLDFHKGGILSLLCILASSIFLIPWDGLKVIQINRRLVLSLLPSTILVAIFTWMTQHISTLGDHVLTSKQSFLLFGFVLLIAIPLVLIWHVITWRPESGVVRLKGKLLSVGFVIFSLLYMVCCAMYIPTVDPRLSLDQVPLPSIFSNVVLLLLIPCLVILFIYPRISGSWDLDWEDISRRKRIIRVVHYLIAGPVTLICFLLALNNSLAPFVR